MSLGNITETSFSSSAAGESYVIVSVLIEFRHKLTRLIDNILNSISGGAFVPNLVNEFFIVELIGTRERNRSVSRFAFSTKINWSTGSDEFGSNGVH